MKVEFWVIGKTSFPYLEEGIGIYKKRLTHYLPFKMTVFPDVKNAKNLTKQQLKEKEGALILNQAVKGDCLILMDENGKSFSSMKFAGYMEKQLQMSHKRLVFLVGGAYGFSEAVYQRSNTKLSLSSMTFSHQMVRLIFLEQLYRAMTILRKEPYHHQ